MEEEFDPYQLSIIYAACSSTSLNWYNETLIVPNGSLALTANNCIKCSCGQSDLRLQCSPSGIVASCSHLQCKGSNLFIGDTYETQTAFGCNITACVYRGHSGRKIFRSLVDSSQIHCSGNGSSTTMSPFSSPSPTYPEVPISTLSPSPSLYPSSASIEPVGINASDPRDEHNNTNISTDGQSTSQASCLILLLLELTISFFL
ncbi:hypothetical protein F0562_025176 [Nyssa sinensis]|uniref:Uncharacterized protein n=1 Tax=Nyssa sinensis TaxID=561372 RepID=A0A5J5BHG3_9ASTE|nr:hypothetical protein F0562_025176 [Nyssa sinensis]